MPLTFNYTASPCAKPTSQFNEYGFDNIDRSETHLNLTLNVSASDIGEINYNSLCSGDLSHQNLQTLEREHAKTLKKPVSVFSHKIIVPETGDKLIIAPSPSGFAMYNSDSENPFKWKFHLSINRDDLPGAFDLLLHNGLLSQFSWLKISNITRDTTSAGKEIVFYVTENEENLDIWQTRLNQVEQFLQKNNIRPGPHPKPDRHKADKQVKGSLYSYYRNGNSPRIATEEQNEKLTEIDAISGAKFGIINGSPLITRESFDQIEEGYKHNVLPIVDFDVFEEIELDTAQNLFDEIEDLVNSAEGQEFLKAVQVGGDGQPDPEGEWIKFTVINNGVEASLSLNCQKKEIINSIYHAESGSTEIVIIESNLWKLVLKDVVATIERYKQKKNSDQQEKASDSQEKKHSPAQDSQAVGAKGNSGSAGKETPSPKPKQPLETISLEEKAKIFNILNQHNETKLLVEYSQEKISDLKKEFQAEKENINSNLSDEEFFKPKKYSGIGIKAKYSYVEDSGSAHGGQWVFDIEEVIENSPAAKAGFRANGSIAIEGAQNSLKTIIQDIRNGKLKISKDKPKTPTSVFELNEAKDKYELFNFEKSAERSAAQNAL